MYSICRSLWPLVILPVAALAAAHQQAEWARDSPPPPLLPGPLSHALIRRIAKKELITDALLDGRITLFEAAAQFRRVYEEEPSPAPVLDFPGESLDERLCYQVIWWAQRKSSSRFSQQESRAIVARLEEELRRHKEWHGKVVLPESTAAQ